MMIRKIGAAALTATAAFLAAPRADAAEARPNIIVIISDDQGYADVGFHGSTDVPTPNLDSLAATGVKFSQAYVTHSYCSPSRAGLLSGRYQQRFGHEKNPYYDPTDEVSGLSTAETLLPAALKKAGYVSGLVGKWHLGATERYHPLNRGFDEFFGFLGGGHRYLPEELGGEKEYDTRLVRGRESVDESEYLTDALSREAADFVARRRDRPFFLEVAYNAPHTPLQAPPKYLDRVSGIADEKRRKYAAMVSAVDDGVGRILAALRDNGLEERTLIFFFSDNGGPPGNGSSNHPFRGHKATPYEGGVRVPFVARWKGTLPAGSTFDRPISTLDVFATAAALAGVSPDPERPLDGVDLIPYLRDGKAGSPHDVLYWRNDGGKTFAVREGNWKLILPSPETVELYDLAADPAETRDLSKERPEVVRRLQDLKNRWNAQLVPPAFPGLNDPRPARPAAKPSAS